MIRLRGAKNGEFVLIFWKLAGGDDLLTESEEGVLL
jgi:hypothetical protein